MQFKVPQFIDVEDKIFGPFSFKEFAYIVGGLGASYVVYKIMPLILGIFLIIPILALAGALTFIKINNRPFIDILQSAFQYAFQDKLYVWKKAQKKKKKVEEVVATESLVPRLSESKLKDLSWSLDVLDARKNSTPK